MKFGVKLFQTNYCHACHKRFAVFFPLPYAYCCVSSLFTVYDGKNTYNRLSPCSLFLAFRFWWRRKEMWAGKTAWRHAALPSVNAWNMQASDDVKISIQEYDWCENQSKRWQQYEILISGVWTTLDWWRRARRVSNCICTEERAMALDRGYHKHKKKLG